MSANCPQQVATVVAPEQHATASDDGLGAVVLDRVGQLLCAMHGHDHMLQHEEGRLFLRCMTCGHESPGWDVPTRLRAARVSASHVQAVPALPIRRVA